MRRGIHIGVAGLVLSLVVLMATLSSAAAPQIKLIVDGREIEMDSAPVNINGRVYVPARYVAEALGAKVEWDAAKNAVVITSKEAQIAHGGTVQTPGQAAGHPVQAEPDNRLTQEWIPLRSLVETYGFSVGADQDVLTLEGRGLRAVFPLSMNVTDVLGITSTGTTIRGRIENGRLLLLRSDLERAGFIND